MDLRKYISKNRHGRILENAPGRKYLSALVIPACAEAEDLPKTLESLAGNPASELARTLVLLVINNPPSGKAGISAKIAENQETLRLLRNSQFPFQGRFNISWIDASSPGLEINPKEGVGAARKIGMDASLEHLDFSGSQPLIISLDADTLAEENYLGTVREYFTADKDKVAAAINFEHQPGGNPGEDAAITAYELFMRYYVEGLRISGSPYAYHVLGSAMAFRAGDYVRAGGMRKRNGGEDFYFMQAMRKVGEVGQITGTTVRPSSRASDRVPFGTGPRISQILESGKGLMFYNPEIFMLLKKLFSTAAHLMDADALTALKSLDDITVQYLAENDFFHEWEKILRNTPDKTEKVRWAFHTWFDAFRTLKFVHYCEGKYPDLPLMEAYAGLFEKADVIIPESAKASDKELLGFMRRLYGTSPGLSCRPAH